MSRKYTSRILRTISYLWISFPVAYIVYATLALALTMSGLMKMVLSPWYWFVSIVAVVSGIGIAKIRWYAWYAYLFSNFTIAYQTAIALVHYSDSSGQTKLLVFAATLVAQLATIYVVAREIRVPYFFPRIRWWESDPRYKLSVQVKLTRQDKSEMDGEIMDLSMGGCFVKTHSYFTPDEEIKLDFALFERHVECVGHVVWRTESTVTHPKGVGIKFSELNKETILCLKQATQKLKKLARAYSEMTRERNWQEYVQREQTYQGKPKK